MEKAASIDVMVLGAGGGGYPAAFRLAGAGRAVVMVDPFGNLGGDCLAEGCVPSKAVREAALVRTWPAKYPLFGLRGETPEVDWRGVLAHKDRVQSLRYAQHREEIAASTLTLLKGSGRIVDDHTVEVTTEGGDILRYHAQHLIIATGSRPHRLPIPGAELAVTSHDIFRLGADLPFPRRLVAIGGGYIGLETASMLQNLGAEVTVLEATEAILPGVDPALAGYLHRALARRLTLVTGAKVTAIAQGANGGLQVRYESAGEMRDLAADCVLMATGREPVVPEGIAALGLPAGRIGVDDRLRTALAHVYAPGDVNGRSMLFHSAVCQSVIVAEAILSEGQAPARMNFASVPFTVFTEPEVAWVGVTEAQAARQGIAVVTSTYDFRTDSRAQIFDEREGFLTLVFAKRTGSLIGAQVAGLDAAHVIAPLALAVHTGTTASTLSVMAFPHPMVTEGINKAARAVRL
ncbi:dihydrolipoyl dehydrogenase [Acidibrevibacterium fodinaquatile]|uniref:dihydrolipoyl dehydrogenase n=1 Tax=Acidibrevibacterium fodinaquatile TaxID=1969806 RepID=UPI000E0D508B|nr:dihydrolipoyl dehydrogenase [Acidibrevibacterium fodinaquatile]